MGELEDDGKQFPKSRTNIKETNKRRKKIRRLEHQPRKSNLQINEFRKEKTQNLKKIILE